MPCSKLSVAPLPSSYSNSSMSLDHPKLDISYFYSLVLTSWILQCVPVAVVFALEKQLTP